MALKLVKDLNPGDLINLNGEPILVERVEGNAAIVWLDPSKVGGEANFGCGMYEEIEVLGEAGE